MLVISLASWSAALLRRFAWLGCMPAPGKCNADLKAAGDRRTPRRGRYSKYLSNRGQR